MRPKGKKDNVSSIKTSGSTTHGESNSNTRLRSSKKKQEVTNRHINENDSSNLHLCDVQKPSPDTKPTDSARTCKKGNRKQITGSEITEQPDSHNLSDFAYTRKSQRISKVSQQTKHISSPIGEKGQSFYEPSQSKKKRFDSGDSSSFEIQNITLRSDSGFETESNRSSMSPYFHETVQESGNKGELCIDFADNLLSPVCSQMWPNLSCKVSSIAQYFCNRSLGKMRPSNAKVIDEQCVLPVSEFEIFANEKPFTSRVTTIDWHPRKQNLFCATSKHGDLGFYQINSDDDYRRNLQVLKTYSGIGPGGYISAFKFHPVDNERFFTSTLEGKVVLGNTNWSGNHVEKVLLETGTWDFWYCSMDVSPVEDFVVAGRNNGLTFMCSKSGEPIWQLRLHSAKVTHAELSPREPHILCTASLDHSVRVWDLRMIREVKGKPRPVEELLHKKGVNSAYFSQTDGLRLLTTDQHDEIRVYRAPFWHLESTIIHPHRFFRYLTPHKAAWHPLTDKIVIGRYPGDVLHPEFGNDRTIDMFDAQTGKMNYELKDSRYNGLVSLCKFNNTGDILLSTMGHQFNLWGKEHEDIMKEEPLNQPLSKIKKSESSTKGSNSYREAKRRRELAKMKMKLEGQ
ncbi:hypothetical protein EGW08_012180 [Elysia chlorotica]|uniref:DNA damage-binding protein 2 n=1 Tax=Elysia chlorotica TaxID=188477 RepID=A0A3S1BG63_ELYCH|nr:hypothetical protein EGW08_012180 [Elysia chlorotica]